MAKKRLHINLDDSLIKKLPMRSTSQYLEAALVLCYLGGISPAVAKIAQEYGNSETRDLHQLTLNPQPPEEWQNGKLQIMTLSREEKASNFAEDIIDIFQLCESKEALVAALAKYYHNRIYSKLR